MRLQQRCTTETAEATAKQKVHMSRIIEATEKRVKRSDERKYWCHSGKSRVTPHMKQVTAEVLQ